MLFILLWLVSPIIFLVLFIVQISVSSDLKRKNAQLLEQLNILMAKLSVAEKNKEASAQKNDIETCVEENKTDVQEDTADQTEAPAQTSSVPSDTQTAQTAQTAQPQQLYNLPMSAIQRTVTQPVPVTAYTHKSNTVTQSKAAAPKKKISTINIILILGALFLSLSGFIFAAAAWGILNSFFKAVVLVSFSALFFGIHSFTERKLKLEQTGRIFYVLGSVFLPAAVVAAGLLEVFGEYFSFYGDGCMLVMAMVALSVCIPFFKGAKDYQSRTFAAIFHYSFSAAVIFILFHVIPRADIAVLASAVYSLLIVIAEPFIKEFYDEAFGPDNVFSFGYSYFAIISTTILAIASTCVFLDDSTINLITLIAFALYSTCFLTRTITEKSGTLSVLAFAFFITISLFSGFDADSLSSIACVIAATALIYGSLSAMGFLPETIRNTMLILSLAAAFITGLFAVIENIIIISEGSAPSIEVIIAAGVICVEMLILTLRNGTNAYKALTFCSLIWFVTDFMLLFELGIWSIAVSFGIILAYYLVTSFTRASEKLFSPSNNIIFGIYTLICSAHCCINNIEGYIVSIIILVIAAICITITDRESSSPVFCPIFTFQLALPLILLFNEYDIILPYAVEPGDSVMSIIYILFCLIGAILLFIRKARRFAASYGISIIILLPVFLISCAVWESADFVSMLAVSAYITVFLAKYSFPKEQFAHVTLLNAAIILTSLIAGLKFLDDLIYVVYFPAIAIMLIFAVYALGEAFDLFKKVNPHICTFLWWITPFVGGCMAWSVNTTESISMIIFSIILLICAAFTSVSRKNTLNLIYPIFTTTIAIGSTFIIESQLILAAVLVTAGRILFRKKTFEKLYIDVFSICAFLPAVSYFFEAYDAVKEWLTIIVFALLTLNFIRKNQTTVAKRSCISVAGAFIFPLFWLQPFFEVPDFIDIQFNLLPVPIFCLLIKLLWKDEAEKADTFCFVSTIISLVFLFIESFTSSDSFDAVFIGIVLFIILAISFIIKKKRWFVLAVTSMVASGVLLSLSQRESIAWLIYLALSGAALISLGLANELKKQQQKNGEETKLSRFMSEWTW